MFSPQKYPKEMFQEKKEPGIGRKMTIYNRALVLYLLYMEINFDFSFILSSDKTKIQIWKDSILERTGDF